MLLQKLLISKSQCMYSIRNTFGTVSNIVNGHSQNFDKVLKRQSIKPRILSIHRNTPDKTFYRRVFYSVEVIQWTTKVFKTLPSIFLQTKSQYFFSIFLFDKITTIKLQKNFQFFSLLNLYKTNFLKIHEKETVKRIRRSLFFHNFAWILPDQV